MTDYLDGLPDTIRVGPFDLKVARLDKLSNDDDWGLYTHGVSVEVKRAQPSGPFAVDTVMHEITHGIYRNAALAAEDDEERIASVMATGWTQVLRDNPDLLAWIARSLK